MRWAVRRARPLALAVALGFALVTTSSHAEEPQATDEAATDQPAAAESEECVHAFESSQTLRDEGRLLAARDALQICSDASCPDFARLRCIGWLDEVQAALPSLVIVARDAAGKDLVDVRVVVGGQVLAETLDGRPILLDPGPQTIRFERAGADPLEQSVVVQAGEKNRAIEVRFGGSVAEPPPPAAVNAPVSPPPAGVAGGEGGGISPLVWIGFGVALAGTVIGAVTGAITMGRGSDLEAQCSSSGCSQGEIDDAMTVAHISTASFAVAGVGAVLGVVGVVLSFDDPHPADVAVEALLGPGSLGLRGSF